MAMNAYPAATRVEMKRPPARSRPPAVSVRFRLACCRQAAASGASREPAPGTPLPKAPRVASQNGYHAVELGALPLVSQVIDGLHVVWHFSNPSWTLTERVTKRPLRGAGRRLRNDLGCPAISMQIGMPYGLDVPVSAQIMGRRWEDHRLLAWAITWQEAYPELAMRWPLLS